MSMMVSFVLSFFPRDVLDEILNLIESVSEDFPSYSLRYRLITDSIDLNETALHILSHLGWLYFLFKSLLHLSMLHLSC